MASDGRLWTNAKIAVGSEKQQKRRDAMGKRKGQRYDTSNFFKNKERSTDKTEKTSAKFEIYDLIQELDDFMASNKGFIFAHGGPSMLRIVQWGCRCCGCELCMNSREAVIAHKEEQELSASIHNNDCTEQQKRSI
jgi:hypothetical protein